MISLIEQGFLRRNWGKLALGGGALAFAASRGEDMGYGAAGEAAGTRMGSRVKSMIRGDNPAMTKLKGAASNIARDPNAALQKTATAVGAGVRKGVDIGKETAGSFKQGYSGSAVSPNVPNVKPQSFTPTRPESIGRADAYKAIGAPATPANAPFTQRVQRAGEEIGRRGTEAGKKVQDYLRNKFPSTYGA